MSVALVTMGTIKDPMFVLVAGFYLIAIGIAYKIGSKIEDYAINAAYNWSCLLYTSPSPRDGLLSRMPSSA